ncbi:hypothetical protein [Paractinoplanes durhamensis]|uniref:Integral membrane protein n=1 Tax=Paractinoplanes durhamensis TaxID=113563 RepID=A0ABQ3YRL4_9ACTN|nr:hypothetical protein [Actinoplanes durhamensis]GIE00014.1 hypothetical protein Adu01nite_13640 [Actinoplanes durhamensis]
MSEGAFHAYVGLLVISGLLLSVLAVRGFDQPVSSRIADGVFAVGFLGYATYLIVADPAKVWVLYYAFAAPVVLVVHMFRQRKRARSRRFAAGFTPQVYAAPAAPTPLTPFPPPPAPLGSDAPVDEGARGSSGLANLPPHTLPPTRGEGPMSPRPPMPSGLPALPPTAPGSPPPKPPGFLHGVTPSGAGGRPPAPGAAGNPWGMLGDGSAPAEPPGGSPVPGWPRTHSEPPALPTPPTAPPAAPPSAERPGRHSGGHNEPYDHASDQRYAAYEPEERFPTTPGRHESPGRHSGGYSSADRYSNYDPGERFGTYEPPAEPSPGGQQVAGHDTHPSGDIHADQPHSYETTSRLRRPAWLQEPEPPAAAPDSPDSEQPPAGHHHRAENPPDEWPPRHG